MLCRALLTAVAVSCTFSREVIALANTQGTQRVVQIKDLVCVLWLSGLQKEDLDVNMLRKLQRHNVNIDDMNNEILRQECLYKGNLKDTNTTERVDITTTVAAVNEFPKNIQDLGNFKNEYVEMISKYLLNKGNESLQSNNAQENNAVTTEKTKLNRKNAPAIYINLNNAKQDYIPDKKEKEDVVFDESETKINNIIKFWQQFGKTTEQNNDDTMQQNLKSELKSEIQKDITVSPRKIIQPNNADKMRLIAEYVSKNRFTISTTTSAPSSVLPNNLEQNLDNLYYNLLAKKNSRNDIELFDPSLTAFRPVYDVKQDNAELPVVSRKNYIQVFDPRMTALRPIDDVKQVFEQLPVVNVDEFKPMKKAVSTMNNALNLNSRPEMYSVYVSEKQNTYRSPNTTVALDRIPIQSGDMGYNSDYSESYKTQGNPHAVRNYPIVNRDVQVLPKDFIQTALDKIPIKGGDIRYGSDFSESYKIQDNQHAERENPIVNREQQVLPKSFIQEIAENIKAIILRDIQQEINRTTTASSSTTSTTIASSSTTSATKTTSKLPTTEITTKGPINKTEEANQVIQRFLELFEQVKAIKEKTVITADTKYSMTNVKHEISGSLNVMNKTQPIIKTVEVKSLFDVMPNFLYTKNNMQENPSGNLPMFRNLTPQEQQEPLLRHAPIIQTNSDEIAPLAIPLPQPMRVINQVLVVTTQPPLYKPKNERYRWSNAHKQKSNTGFDNNFRQKDNEQYTNINFNKRDRNYKTMHYNDKNNFREDVTYSQKNEMPEYINYKEIYDRSQKYRPRFEDDAVPISSKNKKNVYNREAQHYNKPNFDADHFPRYRNKEKFHEILEREDNWPISNFNHDTHGNVPGEQYKMRVASRQQLPLNTVKKTTYDDTHFKNFLKTQQKVNDMLERILATKTKMDGPRSVETT